MRALSTALLLLIASRADAQFGAPVRSSDASWWLSVDRGSTRAATFSDKLSNGTWELAKSTSYRATLDYGPQGRTIGVAVSRATVPMVFQGTPCTGCNGQVTLTQLLATYRMAGPLGSSRLTQIADLAIGASRWSDLAGRDGNTLPSVKPVLNFTWVAGIGLGLPLSENTEASVRYEVAQVRHAERASADPHAPKPGTVSVGLATFRAGLRMRLGRQ
ncbi:MAG: hypothetical protein ACYC3L_16380 [Gemmatimonadaceae bacterium]